MIAAALGFVKMAYVIRSIPNKDCPKSHNITNKIHHAVFEKTRLKRMAQTMTDSKTLFLLNPKH